MRVYVPSSPRDLEHALSGAWQPTHGFAVTPQLLDMNPLTDPEELAEVPTLAAAQACLVPDLGPVRCVVVADYPRADVSVVTGEHPAAVTLTGTVPAGAVVCAFVDEPAVAPLCAQARAGDAEALEDLALVDLMWFDASEFSHVSELYPA